MPILLERYHPHTTAHFLYSLPFQPFYSCVSVNDQFSQVGSRSIIATANTHTSHTQPGPA